MIVFIEILLFIGAATLLFTLLKKVLFKNNQNNHIIKNSTITQDQWDEAYQSLPLLKGLSEEEIELYKREANIID